MNYDKQKPLTNEEINYLRSSKIINFRNIPTYPQNNIHVEIYWNKYIPIKITRNEDEVILYGTIVNKENYWVVYPVFESDLDFKASQFKDIKDALKYGLEEYEKWLKEKEIIVNKLIQQLSL